jgi:hypothetical protein
MRVTARSRRSLTRSRPWQRLRRSTRLANAHLAVNNPRDTGQSRPGWEWLGDYVEPGHCEAFDWMSHPVPGALSIVTGYGKALPIASNDTREGREQNRTGLGLAALTCICGSGAFTWQEARYTEEHGK